MSKQGKSAPEDSLDHYTFRWSVLLLLLLALVTWLLPLTPVFQPLWSSLDKQSSSRWSSYSISCWAPMEFTQSFISYTDNICLQTLTAVHRDESTEHLGQLYSVSEDSHPSHDKPYQPKLQTKNSKTLAEVKSISMNIFIKMTVPLTLFIFALGLKMPQVVWIWLSSFGSVNVNKTFESAQTGLALDADSRGQLHSDLVNITKQATRNSSRLAVGYLFCKLLACVVIAAEILLLMMVTLPEVTKLQTGSYNLSMTSGGNSTELSKDDDRSLLLTCEFPIRQTSNVARFTVQCLFTSESEVSVDESSFLWCYQALVTALLTHLAALLVVNVISLVTWICQLLIGQSQSLDLRFVVLMSRENNDPIVTRRFEENLDYSKVEITENI